MKKAFMVIMVIMAITFAGCGLGNDKTEAKEEVIRRSIAWIGYGDEWDYGDGHTAIDITEIGVYIDTNGTHESKYASAEEICKAHGFVGLFILKDTDRIYSVKMLDDGWVYYDFYRPTEDLEIFESP